METNTFVESITDNGERIPGWDAKLEAFINREGVIKKTAKGWTVTVTKSLARLRLKTPITVNADTRASAIKQVSDALMRQAHDKAGRKGVPTMLPVESSNIDAVGYDESVKTLYIKFRSGRTYAYRRVPRAVAVGLLDAGSHGKYFDQNVKDRFEGEEIV